jgi:hypothetical protein
MSSCVSFFTLKYFNLDLEGYYAFNEKLPGRSKIRIKTYFGYSGRHQVHMNFQPLGLKIIRLGIGGVENKNKAGPQHTWNSKLFVFFPLNILHIYYIEKYRHRQKLGVNKS